MARQEDQDHIPIENSSSFKLKTAMKSKALDFYLSKKNELEQLRRNLKYLGVQVDIEKEDEKDKKAADVKPVV